MKSTKNLVADEAVSSATTFDAILGRMKAATKTTSDTALAKILNLRQSSISGAKERQSIPPAWAVQIAQDYGVSLDWLMFGKGEAKREATQERPEPAQAPPVRAETVATIYNDMGQEEFNMGEILAQTIDILNSKTVYTTAIVSNIKAFHKAIATEKKIDDMQAQLNQALSSFQGQLDKIQAENAQLRQELEQSRAESAVRNTG